MGGKKIVEINCANEGVHEKHPDDLELAAQQAERGERIPELNLHGIVPTTKNRFRENNVSKAIRGFVGKSKAEGQRFCKIIFGWGGDEILGGYTKDVLETMKLEGSITAYYPSNNVSDAAVIVVIAD